jgi:hypothetical protein
MARSRSELMPVPAPPAPSTTTRCSRMGTPVTFTAASSVPAATTAVPWMSSLKLVIRCR